MQAREVHEKKAREKKPQGTNAPGDASLGASGACVDRASHSKSTLKKTTGTAAYAVRPPICHVCRTPSSARMLC